MKHTYYARSGQHHVCVWRIDENGESEVIGYATQKWEPSEVKTEHMPKNGLVEISFKRACEIFPFIAGTEQTNIHFSMPEYEALLDLGVNVNSFVKPLNIVSFAKECIEIGKRSGEKEMQKRIKSLLDI